MYHVQQSGGVSFEENSLNKVFIIKGRDLALSQTRPLWYWLWKMQYGKMCSMMLARSFECEWTCECCDEKCRDVKSYYVAIDLTVA